MNKQMNSQEKDESTRPLGRALRHFRIEGYDTKHSLYPAEECLLEAVRKGQPCKVHEVRPEADTEKVRVRAEFVRFLALGGDYSAPVHEKGVWLEGAAIIGDLDFEGCEDIRPLVARRCLFLQKIIIRDARIRTISFSGSKVQEIHGERAHIAGSVILRDGFCAAGEVRFHSAKIDGYVDCRAGQFQNREGYSLNFRYAHIGGGMTLNEGFSANGEVTLRGAEIVGDLSCSGGDFFSETGDALHCQGAIIHGSVWLIKGFRAVGRVTFLGAEIDGLFCCSGGNFNNVKRFGSDNPNAVTSSACDYALVLYGSTIRGTLYFGPIPYPHDQQANFQGSLDLSNCSANVFLDDKRSWPAESVVTQEGLALSCYISLDGFRYGRFAGWSSLGVTDRKAWLKRQGPRSLGADFKPQPFEQLIRVLREMGHERDARPIAILKEETRLRRPWKFRGTEWGWRWNPLNLVRWLLLEKALGYGYRSHRPILAAVIVWLFAAAFFNMAAQKGIMAPSNPVVFLSHDLGDCRRNWTDCKNRIMANEHTPFQPTLYALDILLPIVQLGQETAWSPMMKPMEIEFPLVGNKTLPSWLGIGLMWFAILFGWTVGLILVAVVGGAVRRD